MEYVGLARKIVWKNAGFGALRKIQEHLLEYEPRYEPTVVPLDPREASKEAALQEQPFGTPEWPDAHRYYTTADYRRMYLSGELTPTAVAKALLPLIRRDVLPPGEHSMAFFDTKVDKVLQAAEASTLRYLENRSLGPLDGVPTAVKDEYEVDGYSTCLGSVNDYSAELAGAVTTSWCVQKLDEAGALILGKLNMHEFGLGKHAHARFRSHSGVGRVASRAGC